MPLPNIEGGDNFVSLDGHSREPKCMKLQEDSIQTFFTRRVALRGSNIWMSTLRRNTKHTTILHEQTTNAWFVVQHSETEAHARSRSWLGGTTTSVAETFVRTLDNHSPCSSVKAADVFDQRGPPQSMQQDWPEGRVCNVTVAGTGTKFKSVGHRFSSTFQRSPRGCRLGSLHWRRAAR